MRCEPTFRKQTRLTVIKLLTIKMDALRVYPLYENARGMDTGVPSRRNTSAPVPPNADFWDGAEG